MIKLDLRTAANMDTALEEVCSGLPHGGDHETRKHIASQLIKAARRGNDTLDGLKSVRPACAAGVVELQVSLTPPAGWAGTQ